MKYAARIIAIAVTMLPLLASAQLGSGDKVRGNVPFEFVAASKIVPAGDCTIQLAGVDANTLAIRNRDANIGLFSRSMLSETPEASRTTALVFHKYGDRYFLAEVKLEGSRTVYRMPVGKAEAEMRASNVPATEEILLASSR